MSFISPHCHIESPLTASTLANLIQRAKDLGRTHFAAIDHGHLSSALKAYGMAKKKGLKPILGIEIYFKDPTCPIISGTDAAKCRYFTLSIYAEDQEAYQELCKIVSRTDFTTTTIQDEVQQLWTWKDLESLSKFNFQIVLGGIHCMVGKTFLSGQPVLAYEVFKKILFIFPNRVSASLLCEVWSKKFQSVIEIKYSDGSRDTLLSNDTVSTDKAKRIKAIDLANRSGHTVVHSKSVGGVNYTVEKNIKQIVLHAGFLPLPGGDATLNSNRFLKAVARKLEVPVIATDYAYYANKDDKIVQTMILEGKNRLQPTLNMKPVDDIKSYFIDQMGLPEDEIANILSNNDSFAHKFDNFELKYSWRLAEVDGDPLTLAMAIIKKNGRMKWNDPVYVDRLKEEIGVIAKNPVKDLTAYFLPIVEVMDHYKSKGQLTSVGRGSAGGSLFCYLLGITNLDPITFDLPFNRFFSLDRIMSNKLPDVDVDLPEKVTLIGEDGCSGFLYERWGNRAARISTRATIRLKSAIKDTNRFLKGKVEQEIETLTKGLPPPPQGVSDLDFVFGMEDADGEQVPGLIEQSQDLKEYSLNRPKEWEIVSKSMSLTRAFSIHACFPSDETILVFEDNQIKEKEIIECHNKNVLTGQGNLAKATLIPNGTKKVYKYTLSNGTNIRSTEDHLFLTKEKGWQKIATILKESLTFLNPSMIVENLLKTKD